MKFARRAGNAIVRLRIAVVGVLAELHWLKVGTVALAALKLRTVALVGSWGNAATGVALLVGGVAELWRQAGFDGFPQAAGGASSQFS
jgi:hypothetical protein